MVIYVILGGALALLLVQAIRGAKTASRAALANSRSLTSLEDKIAEWRLSMQQEFEAMVSTQRTEASTQSADDARQSLQLPAEIRALAELQAREFSRVRALLEVLPHSVGALQRALTQVQESTGELREQLDAASAAQGERMDQIRPYLPPPKTSYEDPVPFIEGMSEADVLRIAQALTIVRPLTPYPNWYFDADWQNADLSYRIRRSIWTYFSRRKVFAALDVPWYARLKLRIYLGNDQSRQQFVAGCLDPNEFALLDKLLMPGMVFFDVGANEGFYSVFASRLVGETGSVWAFEPSRREMERLTANVGLNGLTNVRPVCVALADEDGDGEILIACDEHSGHNTLGQFVYESGPDRREAVLLRRLDSLLEESALERLDFLKIDAEGAEMRVLAGAEDALRRFRPLILLEMNDRSLRTQGSSRDNVIRYLESHDYRLYLFDPATGLPVPAFEGRYGDNMLAVPVERNLPEPALLPLPATGSSAGSLVTSGGTIQIPVTGNYSRMTHTTGAPAAHPYFSAAQACWNQREMLARLKPRLLAFAKAAEDPTSLNLYQHAQLTAAALEFRPDVILELGRGHGNSTCDFTEVANLLGAARVLSLDQYKNWNQTAARLREFVQPSWFDRLHALETNILTFDFKKALAGSRRVLLFWDAHGFEIAKVVLGRIMPELADREHLVIMHDIGDLRHQGPETLSYGDNELWTGGNNTSRFLKIGFLDSNVEQAVAILDFSTRNRFPLYTADHSLATELNASQSAELARLWGDMFSLYGQWLYFSLREAEGALTFPKLPTPVTT